MIIDLVKELDRCIEALEELRYNEEYNKALEVHRENNRLVYGGYSLNLPRYINKIFEDYVSALTRVEEYRENDKNYLQTISDLGRLSYLYEK
jgi:hypothetical protein